MYRTAYPMQCLFAATITPLPGWDIVGEMKVRFDVEDNSFKRGYPTVEKPDGELKVDIGTKKQGYVYPGMEWKNSKWGSYTRGNAFNYYLFSECIDILRPYMGRTLLQGYGRFSDGVAGKLQWFHL